MISPARKQEQVCWLTANRRSREAQQRHTLAATQQNTAADQLLG